MSVLIDATKLFAFCAMNICFLFDPFEAEDHF